jgi:hypothetical protein
MLVFEAALSSMILATDMTLLPGCGGRSAVDGAYAAAR